MVEPLAAALVQTLSPDAVRGTRSRDRRVERKGKRGAKEKDDGIEEKERGRERTQENVLPKKERSNRCVLEDKTRGRNVLTCETRCVGNARRSTVRTQGPRKQAESFLKEAAKQPGYGSSILQVRVPTHLETSSRRGEGGQTEETEGKRILTKRGVSSPDRRTSLTDAERPPTNTCT